MKYVIELIQLNAEAPGVLNVAMFSEHISHCDYPFHVFGKAVGAGFCSFDGSEVVTYGESTTLKMKPHPSDGDVLLLFLGGLFEQQRLLLAMLYEQRK